MAYEQASKVGFENPSMDDWGYPRDLGNLALLVIREKETLVCTTWTLPGWVKKHRINDKHRKSIVVISQVFQGCISIYGFTLLIFGQSPRS